MKYLYFSFLFLAVFSSTEIKPFKINFSNEGLIDLQNRLNISRLPDEIENQDWSYGTNKKTLQELINYWKNGYDWRKEEAKLNDLPQFTTQIDDINVHFIHIKSNVQNAKTILFLHGWPGSFYECTKVIPLLKEFNFICPSLPGYGFSSAPKQKGFTILRVAETFIKLMERLNYSEYIVQGGDWGGLAAMLIAQRDPKACKAVHLNFAPVEPFSSSIFAFFKGIFTLMFPSLFLTERERNFISKVYQSGFSLTGYFHIQSTRPQTVGYGLNDSPTGLAAYILEKFYFWSDCKGNVERQFSKDDLLNNIMIYWISGSITSSMRLYYETMHDVKTLRNQTYVSQPVGFAAFPEELIILPRSWMEYRLNVQRYTYMEKGGHFAALEEPELLANDIKEFIKGLKSDLKKDEL